MTELFISRKSVTKKIARNARLSALYFLAALRATQEQAGQRRPDEMANTALSPPPLAMPKARDGPASASPLGELPSAPTPPTLDLTPLQALAQRALLSALDQIAEPKTLLLDAELAGPLGLVCDVASLRAHGVERMFWLEENAPKKISAQSPQEVEEKDVNAPTRAVVYVCRPQLGLLKVIAGELALSMNVELS